MNITLHSSILSIPKDDHERLTHRREQSTFKRFLSFNENTLSSVENRRRSIKEEEEELNFSEEENLVSHECNQCSKIFASEYRVNYHINMHHPNQSILCSECNIIFRSHRTLKTHQQRYHSSYSQIIPNYSFISSYLVVAFSSKQFPFIAKNACEQGRLPLGYLTSKLYRCEICQIAFPCSRTLKYHLLTKHEQYDQIICENILQKIILQIEETVDDEIESIKILLAKQASQFGLVNKQLVVESRRIKQEQNRLIFPTCQHRDRTCANLCLNYLSSYYKLIENYPYKILTVPKGNPFAQGSIVSKSMNESSIPHAIVPKEVLSSSQKRKKLKRINSAMSNESVSPQSKKKYPSNITTIEQSIKTNETKSVSLERTPFAITSTKKNHTYVRSLSSILSTSSTSTRTSSSTVTRSSKHLMPQTTVSLKRSISPTITLSVERSSEKRRRQREQRKELNSSSVIAIVKIDDDIEQENGDDDLVAIKFEQPKSQRQSKQRQASSGSIEYVQILNNDQQSTSSLNNIENLKLKSKINDEEIIICRSPPSIKPVNSSPNNNHSSKTSLNTKANNHQTPDDDEQVRVRCKVCGDILEGRSCFSQHVLTMHSHLLKKSMSDTSQQQIAIVR